ncbi:FAD-binding monooxygenase, partial [Saccharothrix sp. ST-888]
RRTDARLQRQAGGPPQVLQQDLGLSITDRRSRTPRWLEDLGSPGPEGPRVELYRASTPHHFPLDADPFGDDLAILPVATPAHPRGAFFYPLPGEDNRVELSRTGVLGDHPPTDPECFLAYARSLP